MSKHLEHIEAMRAAFAELRVTYKRLGLLEWRLFGTHELDHDEPGRKAAIDEIVHCENRARFIERDINNRSFAFAEEIRKQEWK